MEYLESYRKQRGVCIAHKRTGTIIATAQTAEPVNLEDIQNRTHGMEW